MKQKDKEEPVLTCYITTLGCSKNLVDSELLVSGLEEEGFKRVRDPLEAEVIVINTCGFIETAQQESINAILEAGELKKKGSCRILAVTGCLSQRFGGELFESLPEIDIILGTGNFMQLPALLRQRADILGSQDQSASRWQDKLGGRKHELPGNNGSHCSEPVPNEEDYCRRICQVGAPGFNYPEFARRTLLTPRHSVNLKIAEGCSNRCSYCVIPSIRGDYRSRPMEGIINEAKLLIQSGAREINLIAQDTSAYGEDLTPRQNLAGLLEELAGIEGMGWLRVLYTYPTRITKGLLKVIKEHDAICSYLDIPLQHCNETVLKSMNRTGSMESLLGLMHQIRDAVPDITLRTTFITGFPGETEREFAELMKFIEQVQFDWVGVFPFSPQEGTPAYALRPRVSKREAGKRADALMDLQWGITQRRNSRLIGRRIPVLVEGKSEERQEDYQEVYYERREMHNSDEENNSHGLSGSPEVIDREIYIGRTQGQAPEVDGAVYVYGASEQDIGQFVEVDITGADNYDLVGEVAR